MIGLAFRLELRRSRIIAVGLALVALVYGGLIAAIYPILLANTAMIEDYMKLFPKEIMAGFGMTGNLAAPGIFFTTYIGSFLWPVAAAMAGIVLATRPVAADLDRGYLELTLATPTSRVRLLGWAIVGQLIALGVLVVVMIGAVLVGGWLVNAGFDAALFLRAIPVEVAFGAAIAGPATLLSVVTLSRGRSAGIVAGALIAMYLIRIVVGVEPSLDWLGRLSLFQYADVRGALTAGSFPIGDTLVLAGIGAITWVAALALFRRRDLAA
jgi:ABC-type transport system involved in multi-copper enzyme maturation permease subunit